MIFRFIEFNDRRWLRGVEAARVSVREDQGDDDNWLWMSRRDIAKNMKAHGRCVELLKAYAEYAKREPATPQEEQGR
jgi:hypothetical protein